MSSRPNRTSRPAPDRVPPRPVSAGKRWSPLLGCVLLSAAVLIAYLPALKGDFIWDDEAHVTRPALQSLDGLRRIWFDLGATQQYYPVLHSAFWLEHRLWGDLPAFYHLANVLLHAAAACLFALVLRRLLKPAIAGAAWLAALLFALHPVCVESVAWVSEEKNTLSTVFYLLAGWAYLRWREERRPPEAESPARGNFAGWPLYVAATGFFALGLMSKSVTASLPAALLVVFWWRQGRIDWRRDVAPLIPWFVIGACAGLFTAWVERRYVGASGSDFDLSLAQRGLLACRVVWFYLGKLFWPADLVFIYPRWRVAAGPGWIACAVALAALVCALWLVRGKTRGPLAALLFFVGSLFPALGFLNVYPFIFSFVADHWQYLASLGVFTLSASGLWAAVAALSARLRPVGFAVLAVLAAGLGSLTWRQCGAYRNPETVWRATLGRNPDSWMAHGNLGQLIQADGRLAEAESHYLTALRLRPNYGEAHNNYGVLLYWEGRLPEAMEQYREALRLHPGYVRAASNLGSALMKSGRIEESIATLREVLRSAPDFVDAINNLGASYVSAGRIPEAIAEFDAALKLKPGYRAARNNLGLALLHTGRTEEAIAQFREALRYGPGDPETLRNLGDALGLAGRPSEAVALYEDSIRRDPKAASTRNNLGLVLQALGRSEEAVARFEEALRLDPGYAEAHFDLGNALKSLRRSSGAIAQFESALRLNPGLFDAENNLGVVLVSQGKPAEAVPHFEAAVRMRPDSAEFRNNLGLGLREAGRIREADQQFAEAARLKAGAQPPK